MYDNGKEDFNMKKVIINADDFGMTLGNTIGILHSHVEGVVNSTTIMMNMPYAEFALEKAKQYPNLGVGIHLVLTVGKPLLDKKAVFVDENGNFRRPNSYPNGDVNVDNCDDLYDEWKAQIEKFIEIAKKKPTHIDSHHHIHLLEGQIEVIRRLAREYDIPVRQRYEVLVDNYEHIPFTEDFYGSDFVRVETFKKIITEAKDSIEIMCHPAFIDQRLYNMTSYCMARMTELDVLCQPELKEWLANQDIEMINYTDLRRL